ncbi:MAG: hypothetical protein HQ518_02920 [Rhodopirellula sp.]|nr:hypothetical protein [Rhodopirellula sp.]
MRRPARRFGILVLALALVPSQFSTADAGVIPWLYDAVFGPVGNYGYGGYGYGGYGAVNRYPYSGAQVSYAMPAAPSYYRSSNCGPTGCGPAGCSTSPYTVGYRPLFSTPVFCATGGCAIRGCSTGGCSTGSCSVSGCGTCSTMASGNSTCKAQTAWKSKEAKTEWQTEVIGGEAAVPTPAAKDEAPKPRTFADEPADPTAGQPVAVEKVVAGEAGGSKSVTGNPDWTKTGKPAADGAVKSEEPVGAAAGFGEALRGGEADINKTFSEPVPGVESAVGGDAVPTTTPVLPEGVEGSPASELNPGLDAAQPLNLEEQSSWQFDVPVQRIAFRAGFRRARLARTSVVVNVDYVVPTAVTLRLVSR